MSWITLVGGGPSAADRANSVYRINMETGKKSVLFKSDAGRPIRSELSPDGNTIVYNTVHPALLLVRDIQTGEEQGIYEFNKQGGWKFWWDLSPDGKYIAIGASGVDSPNQLKIISIEGKKLEELLPPK